MASAVGRLKQDWRESSRPRQKRSGLNNKRNWPKRKRRTEVEYLQCRTSSRTRCQNLLDLEDSQLYLRSKTHRQSLESCKEPSPWQHFRRIHPNPEHLSTQILLHCLVNLHFLTLVGLALHHAPLPHQQEFPKQAMVQRPIFWVVLSLWITLTRGQCRRQDPIQVNQHHIIDLAHPTPTDHTVHHSTHHPTIPASRLPPAQTPASAAQPAETVP